MSQKIIALRGISALHAGQPIPGLRSSGKGANRTILDCFSLAIGREKAVFLPPRGSRAPAAALVRACVAWGGSTGCSSRKGLES
jgi:hypothetical protein